MKIKERPELSEKYPAIDGIAKPREFRGRQATQEEERPIRSDVEEIIKRDDLNFASWYNSKKALVLNQMSEIRDIGNIPDLRDGSEKFKLYMIQSPYIRGCYEELKRASEYLEMIKKVRDDMNER